MHADVSDTDIARAARATRTWGGQEAKVIRGGDGRVRAMNPLNGNRIGVVISEEDADLLEDARRVEPASGMRLACKACAIACALLAAFVLFYAGFHTGAAWRISHPIH